MDTPLDLPHFHSSLTVYTHLFYTFSFFHICMLGLSGLLYTKFLRTFAFFWIHFSFLFLILHFGSQTHTWTFAGLLYYTRLPSRTAFSALSTRTSFAYCPRFTTFYGHGHRSLFAFTYRACCGSHKYTLPHTFLDALGFGRTVVWTCLLDPRLPVPWFLGSPHITYSAFSFRTPVYMGSSPFTVWFIFMHFLHSRHTVLLMPPAHHSLYAWFTSYGHCDSHLFTSLCIISRYLFIHTVRHSAYIPHRRTLLLTPFTVLVFSGFCYFATTHVYPSSVSFLIFWTHCHVHRFTIALFFPLYLF